MSKNDIIKFILENNLTIATRQIVISILMALVLGLCIYGVYRITYRGTGYSASFGESLALMAVIISVIMSTIQSNLALSLGLVGSLSIIRFRTAVKDVKDAVFVLWAISVGIACGASVFVPGLVGTLVVAVLLIIFSFKIYEKNVYLLIVELNNTESEYSFEIENVIKENTKTFIIKSCVRSENRIESTYEITLKKGTENILINEITKGEEVARCRLISYNGECIG